MFQLSPLLPPLPWKPPLPERAAIKPFIPAAATTAFSAALNFNCFTALNFCGRWGQGSSMQSTTFSMPKWNVNLFRKSDPNCPGGLSHSTLSGSSWITHGKNSSLVKKRFVIVTVLSRSSKHSGLGMFQLADPGLLACKVV